MASIRQHQEQGYDRHVGMFSPDGMLLQVEYAERAVKLGSSVMAIKYDKGIMFFADKKITSKLILKEKFKKIFEIDNSLTIAGSGVMSDGRRLVEQSQQIAHEHRVKFDEEMDVLSLVKDIANIKQYYSQSGGVRPFGVSFLIGSVKDEKINLYQTTPSGIYLEVLAMSVGELSDEINELLEKKFKKNFSQKNAKDIGLEIFEKVKTKNDLKLNFDKKSIEIMVLENDGLKSL